MSSADEDVLDQNDGNESEALKRGRNDDMDVPKKKVKYIQKYKESYHFFYFVKKGRTLLMTVSNRSQ
jgi:hypothetical protein